MLQWFKPLLSWRGCFRLSNQIMQPTWYLAISLLAYGLFSGLFRVPADYVQGEGFRIIYVHVPCAFLSLLIYGILGAMAGLYLVWRIQIADLIVAISAPIGAAFTLCALVTGALWGKPMWGTWWVWDARLTSELILLFFYMGLISLRQALRDQPSAPKICSILALIGLLDLPIVHYSVVWWNTLHQGPSLSRLAKPTIAAEMLYPLLATIAGLFLFYCALVLLELKTAILQAHKTSPWLRAQLRGYKGSAG